MSPRKKNAGIPRSGKVSKPDPDKAPVPLPAIFPGLEMLLMVGTDHIVINQEENDNTGFMAELIEPT